MNSERPLSDKVTENRGEKQIHGNAPDRSGDEPRGFFEINDQADRRSAGERDLPQQDRGAYGQRRIRRHIPQGESSGYTGLWAALIGLGAGMAAMYFLDPNRGGRRRAVAGDKFTSAGNRLPGAVRVTAVDLSNRARGMWAEATKMFMSDNPSDQVVEARVRSKMGRVVSHPHSIHVTSRDGNVALDGVVLADEVPRLLQSVQSVRGVKSVENNLQPHESARGISSLQGGSRREERSEFMQQNWSPAARLGAGAVGLGLSAVGATLIARSVTNAETRGLFGTGGGRMAITIDKAINVDAPPDVLYALWSNFENFPQFMSNVLEVRNINDNRSHWKVAGPAGVPVEWDAEITKTVPNELIAWKSVEGSTVPNAGYVLFEPNDDGSTEVTVRLSYNPPAGAIGHAIAKAFGADPKSEMDEDLMRMKTLLETGKIPHDAARKTFEPPRGNRVH
jgi:uncharacterized membrane protein